MQTKRLDAVNAIRQQRQLHRSDAVRAMICENHRPIQAGWQLLSNAGMASCLRDGRNRSSLPISYACFAGDASVLRRPAASSGLKEPTSLLGVPLQLPLSPRCQFMRLSLRPHQRGPKTPQHGWHPLQQDGNHPGYDLLPRRVQKPQATSIASSAHSLIHPVSD